MARYSHFDYYQAPSSLEVPAEEEEMKVLDENILDPNSPGISDPRRPSYDNEAFSHRGSVWSTYSTNSDQSRQNSHLGHSVLESSASSFMPVDGAPYGQQSWNISRTASGSCTPTAYDHYPSEAEASSSAPFSGGAVGPVNSAISMGAVNYRGGLGFPSGSVAMSPQSSQGWVPAPMELPDAPPQKSLFRNDSPMANRRDGVRKKNSRFDIPSERNLHNIDRLISETTDEDAVKELKQQKRLLRNRQAA